MTQRRIWFVFAVIAGIGFAIQISMPSDFSDWPETTFDTAPRGHAGIFSLLDRFEATPGRWLSGVTKPAETDTIWWIAPGGACAAAPRDEKLDAEGSPNEEVALPTPFEVTVRPWLEAGGTAVVWLSHPPLPKLPQSTQVGEEDRSEAGEHDAIEAEESTREADALDARERWEEEIASLRKETREGVARDCEMILGFDLPPRELAGLEGGVPPEEGRYSPVVFSVGRATQRREDFDYEKTRTLPGGTLGFFRWPEASTNEEAGESDGLEGRDSSRADLAGWRPLWVEADAALALALERKVGKGLLIVIADARILSNDRLGHVDSAPFIFDWVRDYGRPWIDEHAHGVVPETGTFRYLAQSPAWAAGLGFIVLGLLIVWRGHAWPTREVSEFDPNSPTLSTFVDSVARLYSGTQDHAQVFDRYRLVCVDRIRRALGLSPGTEVEIILAALRARAGNWPQLEEAGLRHLLIKPVSISSASDLARNVARLDDLVRVLRESGRRENENLNQVEPGRERSKGNS